MKNSCSDEKQVDILIVGGGLIGAALMLALENTAYSSLLVESVPFLEKSASEFDARSLALSPASIKILQMLGAWKKMERQATPIWTIHVSEQQRFGQTQLAWDGKNPLGYVLEMHHLTKNLYELLNPKNILTPADCINYKPSQERITIEYQGNAIQIKPKCIIAADGSNSLLRRFSGLDVEIKDYQQRALVVNIGLARPHKNQAFERFTRLGPLALLPMSEQRSALIWSLSPEQANTYMSLSDQAFLHALKKAFGYKLGRFIKVGQRSIFPLRQIIMPKQALWPLVFIGNAAHSLHPIAGQGFNLGLRDVATLAECIDEHGLNQNMLQQYLAMRYYDQQAITHLTDGLVEVFRSSFPGMGLVRQTGLMLMDNCSFLKDLLAMHARGNAGTIPNLACGIPLQSKEHI